MSNNDDITDDDFDLEEDSFEDFEKKDRTLGDLWRESPLLKAGVIGGVGVIVVFFIYSFGGETVPTAPSVVGGGSEVSAPPGTEEASPAYVEAVIEENEARTEEAMLQGTSALPTPIDTPVGRVPVEEETGDQNDPLARWRELQEERLREQIEQQPAQPAVDPQVLQAQNQARAEAVQALSETMSGQMQAILDTRQPAQISNLSFSYPDDLFEDPDAAEEGEGVVEGEEAEPGEIVLVEAAEIEYAQLLIEANTDVPGPVLAQIVSGSLEGSRMIGDFEVQKDFLTLNFNTIVIDGESYGIDAIALNPSTSLPGMATEVDRRYLQRILLPAAAAFVEGAAEAISESGLTTVTVEGDTVTEETEDADTEQEISAGIEEGAAELRSIIDEEVGEVQVLIRIAAGTPMGVLFLEPVTVPGNPDDND